MVRWVRRLSLALLLSACGASAPPRAPDSGFPPPATDAPTAPPQPPEPPPAGPFPAAAPPTHDPGSQEFEPEIRAFEESDRVRPPKLGGIVFVGSSSIRLWKTLEQDFPRHPVLNRGFGGARIPNVIDFADRAVIVYAPRLIVFFCGSNDIHAGATAQKVLGDFRNFVALVRASLPTVQIDFVSITTSPSRFAEVEIVRDANRRIREYVASDARMSFIDVFEKTIDAAGKPRDELYIDDRLHPSAKGYAIWKQVIEPYLGPPE